MKKLDTSAVSTTVGLPIKSGSLQHIQAAYTEAIAEIVKALVNQGYDSTKVYILNGLINSGSGSHFIISAGSVFFNGEVYLVDAVDITVSGPNVIVGTITTSFFSAANADGVEFTDGIVRNIHQIRKVVLSAGLSGSGTANYLSFLAINENIPQLNPTTGGIMSITGTYPNLLFSVTVPNRILRAAKGFVVGDPGNDGTVISAGVASKYNVPFSTIGTTNYLVLGTLVSNSGTDAGRVRDSACEFTVENLTATGFGLNVKIKDNAAGPANLTFDYVLISMV